MKERQSENAVSKSTYQEQVNIANEHKSSIVTNLIFYLNSPLFKDVVFISMFVYSFGNGYCLAGWLIYLVPFAIDVGLPSYKAVSLSWRRWNSEWKYTISTFDQTIFQQSDYSVLYFHQFSSPLSLSTLFNVRQLHGAYICIIRIGCAREVTILCLFRLIKEGVEEDRATKAVMWTYVSYNIGAILSGFISGLYRGASF